MSETDTTTVSSAADAADADVDADARDADSRAGEPISKDTQFGMLKNRRRRDILRYLRKNDDESTLSDLAEFIAAKENGVERRLLSSDERKRVYIGLYQCHLPKMDDARVIDFDKRSGGVSLRPEADQLFEYIDGPDEDESDEAGDDPAPPELTTDRKLRLGLCWSLCLLALLSTAGFTLLPPVGLLGGLIAVTFATVETVDALPSLRHGLSHRHG
jgi:hypothetical protein